MSSVRPLATITLLALVGVFLYLKINETDPPLPADIANWTMPNELEIGASAAPEISGSTAAAPPATTAAPTFHPATNATSAPPATTAPSFSASPPASEPQTTVTSDAPPLEVPDLPPLPAMPPAKTAEVSSPAEASTSASAPPSAAASTSAEATAPVTNASPEVSAPVASAPPVAESPVTAQAPADTHQSSLYSATRIAVQGALDRGELSQALLLLSDWYGDPSLTPVETKEVNELLSQLAGSVIYSTEPRLEPPYLVHAGEQLPDIAQKYHVPWQLLAKINGLQAPDQLQPGQKLKVIRGPFSAIIDLSERRMTLMLDRRYAGQFPLDVDPTTSVEEGDWTVNQKLLTPGNVDPMNTSPAAGDQKSIMLTSATSGASQIVILRGGNSSALAATDPAGRVLRLKPQDVDDVYDILSLGSQVTIRR